MIPNNNLIQRSYYLSFLLIVILISSQFITLPFNNIILLSTSFLLLCLSVFQMIEIISIRKTLMSTDEVISRGNERDFSSLNEKNIIDIKITGLVEQLQDSLKQSSEILKENDLLTEQISQYKNLNKEIQNDLNSNVELIKNQLISTTAIIEKVLTDCSKLQESSESDHKIIENFYETYNSLEYNLQTMNSRISESKNISDKEISRSQQLIKSITLLSDRSETEEEQIQLIFKGIENIRDVTGIINDVAEKSSVLSLNASIESAHAGEAGKGFAVVAEEIGVLAETTAEHAESINKALYSVSDLINESQNIEDDESDSYSELLVEMKTINLSLVKLSELLKGLLLIEKPEHIDITSPLENDPINLNTSISVLSTIKSEIHETIEKVDQLPTVLTQSTRMQHRGSKKTNIDETAVKPVNSEPQIEI